MSKKELISFIKEGGSRTKVALYCSSEIPSDDIKFLRLGGKEKGLIICVGTEKRARTLLENILFETVNVPEDFDISFIKNLLSMGYRSDFDKVEREWVLYDETTRVV